MKDDLIGRVQTAIRYVPAMLGALTMALMLVTYPSVLADATDVRAVCLMLVLGAGHLAALMCCLSSLRAMP